ncbi:MAG: UDP-N-acetylglucosamine 2-epimerase (non-hydrolyzing) [Hyphomicrobiales bacterium]|nr:UDP-N-acetylglucosamine 2-epimerase (non-hydrolyzing) [Hyphomicrobiales bacterium]
MRRERFLVCLGTRPEAIKLFPVIKELRKAPGAEVVVCATGQHGPMFDQVLDLVGVRADVNLNVLTPNQPLEELTARLLTGVCATIDDHKPTRIIVQGDTATTAAASLAAYYRKVPVAHVEAGLRSHDIYAPWPEEVNRKVVTSIADIHFAPTEGAAAVLRAENVAHSSIVVTGNTVIDALLYVRRNLLEGDRIRRSPEWAGNRSAGMKLVLATCHRRENFGRGVDEIAEAFRRIVARGDVRLILSVHPNPNVSDIFSHKLKNERNIILAPPLPYVDFVDLLLQSDVVLTDSGGVQEEAPTFGKPVLVMRETTERPEGVAAGTAILVGADQNRIVAETFRLLDEPAHYARMSQAHNPFGDGAASLRIRHRLLGEN